MKKFIYKLLIFMIFFCSIITIYADETNDSGTDTAPTSSSQVETQKKAIEAYCDDNSKISGCLFNKNDSMYTKFKGGNFTVNHISAGSLIGGSLSQLNLRGGNFKIPDNIEVKRAYQTFDGNGNEIYAECSKHNISESDAKKN